MTQELPKEKGKRPFTVTEVVDQDEIVDIITSTGSGYQLKVGKGERLPNGKWEVEVTFEPSDLVVPGESENDNKQRERDFVKPARLGSDTVEGDWWLAKEHGHEWKIEAKAHMHPGAHCLDHLDCTQRPQIKLSKIFPALAGRAVITEITAPQPTEPAGPILYLESVNTVYGNIVAILKRAGVIE